MEKGNFKRYIATSNGNYIFIDEFLINKQEGIEELIDITEFQISNSRINSVISLNQKKLERTGMSLIANNLNVFTFQKYTQFVSYIEQTVLNEEGKETGETTPEQIVEFLENEFKCDEINGSFDDVLIPFLTKKTGFSVFKTPVENRLIDESLKEQL